MKNRKLILTLIAVLLTVGCAAKTSVLDHTNGQSATASIELPRFITALSINNEEVSIPFMSGYPYYLSVPEGPTELRFIYTQNWGRNDRTMENIKSNVLTLNFQANVGEKYILAYEKPPSTNDPDNAVHYVDNFKAWIESGEKQIALAKNSGKSSNSISAFTKPESNVNSDRLTQLKEIWATANTNERKEFMNWVIAPDQ